ncbi:hypothetical protein N7490_001978 [Penicillium lividum]|nr:hypothetical protein N7490_001978 [Penicillium lividum]
MSLASHASDSDSQSVEGDTATEEQADAWMKEYQTLLRTRDDMRRLDELHENLSNYRLADTERFDKQFGTINGVIREQDAGAPSDEPNTGMNREEPAQSRSKDRLREIEKKWQNMRSGESTKVYSDEDHSDQTQQNVNVHDTSTLHPDKPIRSIEGDIEMTDSSTQDQQESTQNAKLNVLSKPSLSSVRSSREQSVGSLARGFKCLAVLDPPKKNNKDRITHSPAPDHEDVVDGWGTWRGKSTFVIVVEGPPESARFTFKLRSGYTNERTANISDKELRITEIRDKGVGGRKPYRYTSENVAGVFGAVFEDTGVRFSTRNSCSWARVEWKGLREEDMIKCKVTEGYSWIPKSDFQRLCHGREAAEEKIKEVWDHQEGQYVAWARKQPRSENRCRSTTPCPLNNSLKRLQQQRATSRLRTPDIRISSLSDDGCGTPPPNQRNNVTSTRSNPVSLDEDTESVNSDASSGSTTTTTTSNGTSDRDPSRSQGQLPVVEISRAKFMKEKGSEKWKDMDPSERQKQEVIAHALYDIYKATMLQNNGIVVKDLDMTDSTEEEL